MAGAVVWSSALLCIPADWTAGQMHRMAGVLAGDQAGFCPGSNVVPDPYTFKFEPVVTGGKSYRPTSGSFPSGSDWFRRAAMQTNRPDYKSDSAEHEQYFIVVPGGIPIVAIRGKETRIKHIGRSDDLGEQHVPRPWVF
ncbi:hypothetical protein quinque_006094 [Culex quinquefasciatus]